MSPRIARERARDLATIFGRKEILASDVEDAAERVGLGPDPLFDDERRILDLLLERGRALGIDAMAEVLATDRVTLETVYEPWLVRRGFVERTERGRVATQADRFRAGAGSDTLSAGGAGSLSAVAELRARFPELGRNGNGNGNGLKGVPDTG